MVAMDTLIRHQVLFSLHAGAQGEAVDRFLADGTRLLTAIPGVRDFRAWKQVSPKNDYDFGFSMDFADQAAYEAYNGHPVHVAFVRDRWVPEVSRFLELDFAPLR